MSPRALRLRLLVALAATLAVLGPLGWLWYASLIPSTYSMGSMGYADFGGGSAHAGHSSGSGPASATDVSTLTGPRTGEPAVAVTLVARRGDITLVGGEVVTGGYTLNGNSPGPPIVAREGDLVQVTLVNESVPEGVTLHWHGLAVPNAEDGVAGVTQDAVAPGHRFVYRFVAAEPGTYWYHSHQVADEQVRLGLFGSLVIKPSPAPEGRTADVDLTAMVHTYRGLRTVNGLPGQLPIEAAAGERVRIRVVDTDDSTIRAWVACAPFRMVALDGRDWHEPGPITAQTVRVAAGGRADLEFEMPAEGSPVRVGLGGGPTSVLVSSPSSNGKPVPSLAVPERELELLGYGSAAPVGFDPASPDRTFEYSIGRRPGFVDGRPGLWWSINGHLYPDVPMLHVSLGDIVAMTVENHSGEVHPMHLHGHHVLVLSRNGKASTGGPWWTDTLDVADGESYRVAFLADNPGIWADHCHNLLHATQGLVTHLEYVGYTTPFMIGGKSGNTIG